jgi:hypothetical protein
MKTVKVISHCTSCGFKKEWFLDTNEYGFFQISEAYCPNDFLLLTQELMGHIKRIDDGDSDDS